MSPVQIVSDAIHAEIEIAAPPSRVFAALTDPAELSKWWGSPDMYQTRNWRMDPQAGGTWSCEAASGEHISTVHGRVLAFDPPSHLSYTWNPSWDPELPETTIVYRLEAIPAGTRLTLVHDGFAGKAAGLEGHSEGWTRVLGWLRDSLSKA